MRGEARIHSQAVGVPILLLPLPSDVGRAVTSLCFVPLLPLAVALEAGWAGPPSCASEQSPPPASVSFL